MYAKIKTLLRRLFVLSLIGYAVIVTCVAVRNQELAWENSRKIWMQHEILTMASQAMTHEMRMRVAEQADLCGDGDTIDALRWEFVNELPRYNNFRATAEVYYYDRDDDREENLFAGE